MGWRPFPCEFGEWAGAHSHASSGNGLAPIPMRVRLAANVAGERGPVAANVAGERGPMAANSAGHRPYVRQRNFVALGWL